MKNKTKVNKLTKDEMKEYHRKRYLAKKEEIKERVKLYYESNKEKIQQRQAGYREKRRTGRFKNSGKRFKFKTGSRFVMKETPDNAILPRGI